MLNCAGNTASASAGEITLPSRYSNFDRIGQGAKSVVLKAHDSFLDRPVAIKFIKPEHNDQPNLQKFQNEAKVLSAFRMQNLPIVLDFGLSQCGRPYMVMELLQGTSLKDLLVERGPLSFELAIRISIQILSALEHAHECGVIHRDLKAENVMITWEDDGKPLAKVVDFGLFTDIKRPNSLRGCRPAGERAVGGSPLYMSPEQALGRDTNAKSDIYSFGCILFEMLTGTTPFAKNSIAETLEAHVREIAPSLRSYMPVDSDMIAELDFIISKCLRKTPSKRYASALQLRDALSELHGQMKIDEADRLRSLIQSARAAITKQDDTLILRKDSGLQLHDLRVILPVMALMMMILAAVLVLCPGVMDTLTAPAEVSVSAQF